MKKISPVTILEYYNVKLSQFLSFCSSLLIRHRSPVCLHWFPSLPTPSALSLEVFLDKEISNTILTQMQQILKDAPYKEKRKHVSHS